jgi:hypothetical protein
MSNKQKLLKFFESENNRDWETYRSFLHPQVKWILHSKEERLICGIDNYLAAIKRAYSQIGGTFKCEGIYRGGNEDRIVTILKNSFGELSCDVFEFKDGLIIEEHEFILS